MKQLDMPIKPKAALLFIALLVIWILLQMGYNILHQLNDVSVTESLGEIVLTVMIDIVTNHTAMELLYNGFIIFLITIVIYHSAAQFVLHYKLRRYIRINLNAELSISWSRRYQRDQIKILVINESAIVALSYGLWRPKILISSAVINRFQDEEIEAILLHELYHCKAYHPLQKILLTIISKGFAFVPVINELTHFYSIWMELLADRYAIRRMKTEVPLGQVLLSLIKMNIRPTTGVGTHFANEAVNYRIKQILDPSIDVSVTMTSKKTIVKSFIVLFAMSLLLIGNCLS